MRINYLFAVLLAFIAFFSVNAVKIEEGLRTNETLVATVPTPEDNGLMLNNNLPGAAKEVPPMVLQANIVQDESGLKDMNTLKPAAMI